MIGEFLSVILHGQCKNPDRERAARHLRSAALQLRLAQRRNDRASAENDLAVRLLVDTLGAKRNGDST